MKENRKWKLEPHNKRENDIEKMRRKNSLS